VAGLCQVYLFCQEKSNRMHYHFYLQMSLSRTELRSRVSSRFGKGNRVFSLKFISDDGFPIEYLAYCTKEGKYESQGIPEDVMTTALEYDQKVKKAIKKQSILEMFIEQYDQDPQACEYDPFKWAQIVIQYYKDSGRLYRETFIISIVQTLHLRYSESIPCDMLNRVLERIYSKK